MIFNLSPYPTYRATRVEWLKRIPEHWDMRRLKSVCLQSALYGANVNAGSYSDKGVRFLRTTDITDDGQLNPSGVYLPEDLVRDYILADGDLLISRSGTVGRSFVFDTKRHGRCAYAGYLVRFVPSREILPEYLFWFTKTQAFYEFLRVVAISSTIENVNGEKYASAPLPRPLLTEQHGIVRLLDHANRRTQRYIRAKQKLIALLEEQKQAIIHQAVTGQIDVRTGKPYPIYKVCRVEWLGSVPAHWAVSRLRHRYAQCLGKMLDTKRITGEALIPYLRNSDVQWGQINTEDLPTMDILADEYGRYTVQEGDLLVCEGGDVGRCAIWSGGIEPCGFQKALHRLRPRSADRDATRFLWYVFRVAALAQAFSDGQKSTIAHLTGDKLRAHRFVFPPVEEQRRIVDYLDNATEGIDTSIGRHRRQIDLLVEWRSVLISKVVTGSLDVRRCR